MTIMTDIAADIRKHSPGALPESLNDDLTFNEWDGGGIAKCQLPDDIAEAVLRDAMVRDANIHRETSGWWSIGLRDDAYDDDCCCGYEPREFKDADHGGSLGACYAAWRFARGIA